MTPELSVVIVSYNTEDLLRRCLTSLGAQPEQIETIVVDNGSDESAAMVAKEFPQVKLIKNDYNVGFAAANNQGFAAASGEYVVMLNSDCEVPASAAPRGPLGQLADCLAAHPGVGIVGPRLVNEDGSVQQSATWSEPTLLSEFWEYTLLNRVLYKVFPTTRYPGKRLLTPAELEHDQTVSDLLGACLVFRRSLLDTVGTLDERFFVFLEETDFARRTRRAGLQLWFLPQVTVTHRWGGSIDAGGSLDKRFALFFPGLYKFFAKHHNPAYVVVAYSEALLGSVFALLVSGVLFLIGLLASASVRRRATNLARLYAATLRWHLGWRAR